MFTLEQLLVDCNPLGLIKFKYYTVLVSGKEQIIFVKNKPTSYKTYNLSFHPLIQNMCW